jgi:hypothetical protein
VKVFEAGNDYTSNQSSADGVPRSDVLHLLNGFVVLLKSILMMQNSFFDLFFPRYSSFYSLGCIGWAS